MEFDGASVVVDPENSQFLVAEDFRVEADDVEDLPAGAQEYVEDPDQPLNTKIGSYELGSATSLSGTYRFTESRVEPGDQVYVLGPLVRDPAAIPPGSTGEYVLSVGRDGPLQRLFGNPFVVSDTTPKGAASRQLKKAGKHMAVTVFFAGFLSVILFFTLFR